MTVITDDLFEAQGVLSITDTFRFISDMQSMLSWRNWRFSANATNLLNKEFYSNCLARGDCFNGEARNVFGTLSYRF